MRRPHMLGYIVPTTVAAVILAGTMSPGCTVIPPPPSEVTVTLTNDTTLQVQPFLWADPNQINDPPLVMIDADAIPLGPPLSPPPDGITVTLACTEAGTIVADGDLLDPAGSIASSNILSMQQGVDFSCGDLLAVTYQNDAAGGFFTSVDRNGVHLAP